MRSLSDPDDGFLARVRRGNQAALAEVYDRYAPAIYRYLFRRTGDARVAEDLTGVVFLKLLEAIQHQKAWTTTFAGWLYRIAHNVATDHFRSSARRRDGDLDDQAESGGDAPDQAMERLARLGEIRVALDRLTEEQCQVVLLRFGEELSHREIAAITGKSEGAVKLLQHRALHALRRLLVNEHL